MRLRILSDLHVEFEAFDPPPAEADVVVLAGDIHIEQHGLDWARERFPDLPVLYVLGNHEYYGRAMPRHLQELQRQAAGTNVRVPENEAVAIGDVTFLCCTLWTDFALHGEAVPADFTAGQVMNDYRMIRVSPEYRTLRTDDTAELHRLSREWLSEAARQHAGGKLVVITHHAPSIESVPGKFREDVLSAAYASELDQLVADCGAELWIHGHLHSPSDYTIGNTRVVCNPRGYPGQRNPGFRPDLVVEI